MNNRRNRDEDGSPQSSEDKKEKKPNESYDALRQPSDILGYRDRSTRGGQTGSPSGMFARRANFNREQPYPQRRPSGGQRRTAGAGAQARPQARPQEGKKKKARKIFVPAGTKIVSDLQITDGNFRAVTLEAALVPNISVTPRAVRETALGLLAKKIPGKRVLDLSAGCGIYTMEAISRGALIGSAVEKSARMCASIKKNFAKCEVKEGHGEVFEEELAPFLKRMVKRKRKWDVILLHPPFDSDYEDLFRFIGPGALLGKGGIIMIQHHPDRAFPEFIGALKRVKVVTEGSFGLSFFAKKS